MSSAKLCRLGWTETTLNPANVTAVQRDQHRRRDDWRFPVDLDQRYEVPRIRTATASATPVSLGLAGVTIDLFASKGNGVLTAGERTAVDQRDRQLYVRESRPPGRMVGPRGCAGRLDVKTTVNPANIAASSGTNIAGVTDWRLSS